MKYWMGAFIILAVAACEQRAIDANNPNMTDVYVPGDTVTGGQTQMIGQDGLPLFDADGKPIYQSQQSTGSIADDPNRIVLSDYTQEQQIIDRERYAQQMDIIASRRVEVSNVTVPQASSVNPAAFARSTTTQLGQSIYQRRGNRGRCNYASPYEAQRAFLEAGGPHNDSKGLDPDGDGFACKFDPAPYRMLR